MNCATASGNLPRGKSPHGVRLAGSSAVHRLTRKATTILATSSGTLAVLAALALAGCSHSSSAPPVPSAPSAPKVTVEDSPPDQAQEPVEAVAVKPGVPVDGVETPEPAASDPGESTSEAASPPAQEEQAPPPEKPDGQSAATSPKSDGVTPAQYMVLIKERTFRKEGGALRITYDDLDLEKILGMKQTMPEAAELIPDWLKDLKGKTVRLRGFMLPTSVFSQKDNKYFILTRDTGVCCFGPKPTIHYLCEVHLKPGTTTDYIDNRPFDVVGTFDIKLDQLDNEVVGFYHLRDATVIQR